MHALEVFDDPFDVSHVVVTRAATCFTIFMHALGEMRIISTTRIKKKG